MRRSIGWLVVAALAIAPATALAQPLAEPRDALAWSAVDRCGSLEALRARIAAHLGRPLETADAIQANVEVVRTPIEGDVRATVRISTRRGRAAREVHGVDCTAVVDAVAFVLASAVSEDGAVPVTPPVAQDAAWEFRSVPFVEEPAPPRERLRVQIGFDTWSDAGTLPTLQLGVGGSVALSRGHYRGELGAASWDGHWTPLSSGGDGSGVSLRSINLRGCYGVGLWRLWLCGGVLKGTMRGVSLTGDHPESAWTAASFQTLWSRPISGPLRIAASIEGLANIERPGFSSGTNISHRPEPFALRLGLGFAVVVW